MSYNNIFCCSKFVSTRVLQNNSPLFTINGLKTSRETTIINQPHNMVKNPGKSQTSSVVQASFLRLTWLRRWTLDYRKQHQLLSGRGTWTTLPLRCCPTSLKQFFPRWRLDTIFSERDAKESAWEKKAFHLRSDVSSRAFFRINRRKKKNEELPAE